MTTVSQSSDEFSVNHLYLACTPLQIVNATEARDRFHQDEQNVLVVAHSPRTRSKRRAEFAEMADSLIDDGWSRVFNLKLSKLTQVLFPLVARPIQKCVTPCHTIYTGGFQTQLRHLINTISHEELVVIDGGAGCTYSALRQKAQASRKLYRFVPGMRVQFPSLEDARFFTSYDLDIEPERVLTNDYRVLREKLRSEVPIRDEIVFISQPLERDLGIHIDTAAVIQHAMQYHKVDRCRHILHPREKRVTADSEHLSYLVELFAMKEGYLPKAFVTYMSSAARSIQLIYETPVTCYDIMPVLPAETPKALVHELTDVYRDFKESGLEILDLPQSCGASSSGDLTKRAA